MQLAGLFLIWDFQVRSEALSALAQVPQSDVITSEHWVAIRKGLLAALADEDDHLSVSAVNKMDYRINSFVESSVASSLRVSSK